MLFGHITAGIKKAWDFVYDYTAFIFDAVGSTVARVFWNITYEINNAMGWILDKLSAVTSFLGMTKTTKQINKLQGYYIIESQKGINKINENTFTAIGNRGKARRAESSGEEVFYDEVTDSRKRQREELKAAHDKKVAEDAKKDVEDKAEKERKKKRDEKLAKYNEKSLDNQAKMIDSNGELVSQVSRSYGGYETNAAVFGLH